MRILSTLLVAALGGVIGAAPAAPVQLRYSPDRTEKTENDSKKKQGHSTIGRVVLHADSHRANHATETGSEPAVTTDSTPALRVRRLPSVPTIQAPVADLGADVSAGLLATPPPQA